MWPIEQAENLEDLLPPSLEVRESTKDLREPSSDCLVMELY